MKKLLFSALLLCSTFANALPVDQWNKRFSELNNVPLNAKWNAYGQHAYLRQLLSSRPSYFKNPDDYSQLVAPAPVAPYVPSADANNNEFTVIINRIRSDLDLLEKMK